MECPYQKICGGCPQRELGIEKYREGKLGQFERLVKAIKQENVPQGKPIFADDSTRRRAELTFKFSKGKLLLGFMAEKTHEIADIESCRQLTPALNEILGKVREFLGQFCQIKITQKLKNKKFQTKSISEGEVWLTEAVNGVDILLEINDDVSLDHRMLICEFANNNERIARISVRKGNNQPETIIEKNKPYIEIGGRQVLIPAGTFLQASTTGERALVDMVTKYVGETTGQIADLFCGVGTFSYPLSNNIKNKITAIDSSAELLAAFQRSVNYQSIPNIKIEKKNLFKYPLTGDELKNFAVVVFDPPRAGAAAQCKQIAEMSYEDKPQKIVAVSCNPHTFINDANMLIEGGYKITEITLVDQFVYAKHFELVALFEKV